MSMIPTDDEFLAQAFREGNWERFQHPEKGETFTLFLGQFPILSIHAALTERELGLRRFQRSLASKEVIAALVVRLAKLEAELQMAVEALATINSSTSEVVTKE